MEKYYEGILSGSGKGYGFVKVEGIEENFFIPPQSMFGAIDGDKVIIVPTPREDAKNVAEVTKILEYANQRIIGNLMYGLMGNYVVPDNIRIHKTVLIKPSDLNSATVGDKVVVNVTAQPSGDDDLLGEIVEVLGRATERSVLEKAIIRENKIRDVFPEDVLALADSFGQTIKEKDKIGRKDLTKRIIVTIDGDDTKDIDDAISVAKLENGNYFLGVHIADVGQYVKKGNAIDKEAYARGTSTYFPGYVIPMLPSALSNGICSLNEGEERLTLNCDMEIDKNGVVVNHEIYEGVIKSSARLTYDRVLATINGEESDEKYTKLLPEFKLMLEISGVLQEKKDKEGYLEFDLPETDFELNERGEILSIKRKNNHIVHQVIENFMVVANETVAEHFHKLKIPFIYRVHEPPTPEKMAILTGFMEGVGVPVRLPEQVEPMDYQKILKSVDGSPYEHALNKVLLMSLQKARYFEKCLGHFGLASTYYTHFTSPIRRYPDLSIHRIIKDYLHNECDAESKQLKQFVEDASIQASETEKRSETSERQVDDLKMAEYMQKHIGEVYTGTVNGVTEFGVFIELENTVEGLIRIENLPEDTYEYIEKTMSLQGKFHKYFYGDSVEVRVAKVDLPKRQIDFCESHTEFKEKIKKEAKPRRPKLDKSKLGKKKSFDKKKSSKDFRKNGSKFYSKKK